MSVVARMSAAEYLATPECRPRHTELIDGTVVMNEPTLRHTRAQGKLLFVLTAWVHGAPGRGEVGIPTDVRIDDANVVAPDLWWTSDEHRPPPEALSLARVPDLVVEVRSPSTWARDLSVKLPLYEAAGVAEAWYVDTEARTVLVFRRSEPTSPVYDVTLEVDAGDELISPQLPGFATPVAAIFEH